MIYLHCDFSWKAGQGMNKKLNCHSLMTGVEELIKKDEGFAGIVFAHGPPPLWEREEGFHTLIHIILEQQVSLASAKAAYTRLQQLVTPLEPENFLRLNDEELKQAGFSRQKTRYGRALACAVIDGALDLSGLGGLEDREVKAQLMKVKGIGPWTADIYLLMALGRPDIWPKGDLALEIAFQRLKGLQKKPAWEEMKTASTAWKPWRAVAARLLWHFYLSEQKNASRKK
jgi:DNA-3-methyladenine glycosylase II